VRRRTTPAYVVGLRRQQEVPHGVNGASAEPLSAPGRESPLDPEAEARDGPAFGKTNQARIVICGRCPERTRLSTVLSIGVNIRPRAYWTSRCKVSDTQLHSCGARGCRVRHAHSFSQWRRRRSTEAGLAADFTAILFVLSSLAYHDYEGVALNAAEQPRLVADLGDKSYLILRNHGLLTAGSSPADAFLYMYIFESACAIQVRAQSGGQELIRIPEPILGGIRAAASQVTRGLGSSLAWPGLLRKLDRSNPGYRE
jgi:hypothetical protein